MIFTKRLTCSLAIVLSLAGGAQGTGSRIDGGWWVVVGVTQGRLFNDDGAALIHARIRKCGFQAFNDFSEKFTGFAGGLTVFVLGPYPSKKEAQIIKSSASRCVPDAYIKQGRYLGE